MLFTKENLTLLISILGACAWLPVLFEYFRKPDIVCKILAFDYLDKATHEEEVPFENERKRIIQGIVYIVDMILLSNNLDFLLKNFKVYVKYESMNKELEAKVHYCSEYTDYDTDRYYKTDINKNILYCPVLKKNEKTNVETHFIVETNRIDVEYMKFVFINKNNKECIRIIERKDFENANRIFEQ